MTRRERLEAKAERRREWADKAKARGNGRFKAAAAIADNIPLGQPILIGHHSERHARRDAEKIHNNMSKGCEEQKLAEHHESKADGLERQLETSIFSDDPDAVEALRLKLAGLIYDRDMIKALNKRCRKGDPDAIATVKRLHPMWAACGDDPTKGLPAYRLRNLGAEIRRVEARIADVKARQKRAAQADENGGVLFTRTKIQDGQDEWVTITFSEKPDRSILNSLRTAGFRWGQGRWSGLGSQLPADVAELEVVESDVST